MKIIMKKDIVAGLGEIGHPILKILSKKETIVGYDLNDKLMNKSKFQKFSEFPTSFLVVKKNFVVMFLRVRILRSSSYFWYSCSSVQY